jgi:dTDP-4-dehydrorhamnose reductase
MSTVLITGATGHLGARVAGRASAAGWNVVGTYFTAPSPEATEHLDIRDRQAVRAVAERTRPDVVVHTAAGRDDWRVMADGAAHVALAAAAVGARLVHVSTDAVLSGRQVHYDESALPDPLRPRRSGGRAGRENRLICGGPAGILGAARTKSRHTKGRR